MAYSTIYLETMIINIFYYYYYYYLKRAEPNILTFQKKGKPNTPVCQLSRRVSGNRDN